MTHPPAVGIYRDEGRSLACLRRSWFLLLNTKGEVSLIESSPPPAPRFVEPEDRTHVEMVLFEALAGLFEDPALVAVHETDDETFIKTRSGATYLVRTGRVACLFKRPLPTGARLSFTSDIVTQTLAMVAEELEAETRPN